jgi:hypothetical protein
VRSLTCEKPSPITTISAHASQPLEDLNALSMDMVVNFVATGSYNAATQRRSSSVSVSGQRGRGEKLGVRRNSGTLTSPRSGNGGLVAGHMPAAQRRMSARVAAPPSRDVKLNAPRSRPKSAAPASIRARTQSQGPSSRSTVAANVRVVVTVRKRPAKECEKDVVFIQDGKVVQVAEPRTKVDLTKYTEMHKFSFHEAFDENCSNGFIYSSTVQLVVDFVLSGGNGTCFAFGQTGSSKTFTMLGDSEAKPGLMTLGAHELLQRWTKRVACAQDGAACGLPPNALPHVSVSMLEIYGDEVFDLLHASRARKKFIPREDASKKVRLQSLTRMLMYADVC